MEKKSTRDAYGETLVALGEINPDIITVDSDLSVSTQTKKFWKRFPERFVNVGCAEQNLIGVAAGLAISEKIPFVSTYAIFLCRAWEQIRNTVAYDSLNVKIVVSHAGLTNSSDGASHQSLEDIAIMRVIPNMRVIVPSDAIETKHILYREADLKGPSYIRLNREKTPVIFDESYRAGDTVLPVTEGSDIAIFATGTMLAPAIEASHLLKKEQISASVINVRTLKPLDSIGVLSAVKMCGAALSVEEHSTIGGLGSAIDEVIAARYPVLHQRIGVADHFGESGDYPALLKKHNLGADNICRRAKAIIKRK